MRIQSSAKSQAGKQLKQAKIPASPSQNPDGLLVAVDNPSPALANAAKSALSLSYMPSSLIVGIPTEAMSSSLEQAISQISLKVIKNVSKQIAKSSGNSVLKSGVDIIWYMYGARKLFKKWQSPEKNIPAVLIETTKQTLDMLGSALEMADIDNSFFDNAPLQEELDLVFTGLDAATSGEDICMSLLNEKFSSTELGKALEYFTPIVNSAVSKDPVFRHVKFKPLPQFKLSSDGVGDAPILLGSSIINSINIGTPPITGPSHG